METSFFFFSQPVAGLTNQVPVQDSQASTPLLEIEDFAALGAYIIDYKTVLAKITAKMPLR